jgi:hypothetical protein
MMRNIIFIVGVICIFACKNEQKTKIIETQKDTLTVKTIPETAPDDFRLKDSVLIDMIERAIIKQNLPECVDSERIRNSRVYSLMPDRNDFSCFVINDAICRHCYGSSGYEGAIGQCKNGKVKFLHDAFGKCAEVSEELTNNRRRVMIGHSGWHEELYFNGKSWQNMEYYGNIPMPLSKILRGRIADGHALLDMDSEWDTEFKKRFQIKEKKIYSLEKFYRNERGMQLIECEDYFSHCRELTLPTEADSILILDEKVNGYPKIAFFYAKYEKDSLRKTILTYKKGRYYSYDADIYGRPFYFFQYLDEDDERLKNPITKEVIFKNGVPVIAYQILRKDSTFEKVAFYWNGTNYQKTKDIKQFHRTKK